MADQRATPLHPSTILNGQPALGCLYRDASGHELLRPSSELWEVPETRFL